MLVRDPEQGKIIAIVVPCYNEEAVLQETTTRLTHLLDEMIAEGIINSQSFILYVNDGSSDKTWFIIKYLHGKNKYIRAVNLARNVGHQHALFAGLNAAYPSADIIVSIDADLQDDIEVIPEMIEKNKKGCDIVYGVRKERKTDTWFKRTTALFFIGL